MPMITSILIVSVVVVIGILGFSWVIADRAMSKTSSISLMGDNRWLRQVFYRILLIGIAIVPLVILDATLLTAEFQTSTYKNLSDANIPALEYFDVCPDSNSIGLMISMRDLDSAQDTADADLSLCVGDQVLTNLTV